MAASTEAAAPPSYLFHAINLAAVLAIAGSQPAKGLGEVEHALARHPLDSLRPVDRPYLGLASIYALTGKPALARALVAEYERAVEPRLRGRAAAELDLIRGRLATAEGHPAEAIPWHQRAVRRGLTPAFGLPDLGRAYDLAGESDSAIAVYERYLVTPEVPRAVPDATYLALIYRRLGELYESRGERDETRERYSRFVELWKDCDPRLRPQVVEARQRLAMLSGEPST